MASQPTRSTRSTASGLKAVMPAEGSTNTQLPKSKRCTPAEMVVAQHLQAEQDSAAKQEALEANQCLANIQAAQLCDVDLQTPHPALVPTPGPRQLTSRENMTMLLANGRAGGSGVTHNMDCDADNGADTGKCTEGYSDEEDGDESPVKRSRTILIPDPVTPLPAAT